MTAQEEKGQITETSAAQLMTRIRAGDREALAEAIQRYRPLLERHIRLRLRGSLRQLFDTGDVLGTVARKLDRALRSGDLVLKDHAHLKALIRRMVRQSVIDKHRLLQRMQAVEGPDSVWAERFIGKSGLRQAGGPEVDELLDHAFAALSDERDQRILSMWIHGLSHGEIADRLGLSPDNTRQRWRRIRLRLRETFA